MQLKPISPFEPISTSSQPAGGNWVVQIKWDGVRVLLYNDGSQIRLFNRKKNERTNQYPEFHDSKSFCHANSVILDGEIIAFDQSKPSFHEVMRRDSLKQPLRIKQAINQVPVTYMIFDILFYNGEWVTDEPLNNRQKLLESIITPRPNVQIVQNFDDGATLFNLMKQHQMEGVIYKDPSSTYSVNGKDGRWKKHKVMNDLFAVVGGVTYRGKIVNSLLLGVYTKEQDLVYIGHAGTGKLTQKDWGFITEEVTKMQIAQRPFINEPERSKDAFWVKPELTVKVEYLEFTPGGTMRHPSIQAVVYADKNECTVDQIKCL
ncbi:ATP-dependent DNA ligase [Paenibacillus ehimensis]|uniref:DNA ligase (ATP) n=1 Tax=Paenibacillus ehimensis TaxID=79264 RepID=A0ABT8VK77_9BACL|nr:RNA ligase family protein [Paenibacillus ehimensis]MDO3681351.1 RNA ligase family protein [Paenibacillus ehimensis]MEC0213601.1 RNA ligase family protein [Paenibacillus ehimensis]